MTTRSLCGQWDFCTDVCGTPKHYNTQLPVPGNWKDYSAFQEYNGSAWYRRTFTISPEELKRHLSIRFGGIFRHAEIWLNGNFIEEHEGYQAPFHVDISGQVFCGENTLEVRVDNQPPVDGISNTDLFTILPISLAGIYDPVSLEISENIRISRIYAPVDLKNNTLHLILDAYRWTVTMPSPEKESEYLLTATFRYDGGEICNSWPLFVFPAVVIDTAKEIYLHYLSRHLFEDSTVPVRHFTIPQPIGENQLIVTEFVYGGMLDAVENGASLLLLAGEKTFQNTVTANSFKSPWWEIASIWYLNHTNNRQVCGIAENHPALDTLPYYGSWKLDLFDCIEQAPAINLDALGLCVDPILYGIDLELNRYGYLFEFRLGKGRILVSTLNHSRSDIHASSVIYRIKTLINYAMSDRFSPSSTLSRKQLADALQHDMY